jgi:hypothetical protein
VSVHSWPDGAGLTRVMLEAAAEVVAMGREKDACRKWGEKRLGSLVASRIVP